MGNSLTRFDDVQEQVIESIQAYMKDNVGVVSGDLKDAFAGFRMLAKDALAMFKIAEAVGQRNASGAGALLTELDEAPLAYMPRALAQLVQDQEQDANRWN